MKTQITSQIIIVATTMAFNGLIIAPVQATQPYCLYSPDKNCFEAGWPSCCQEGDGSNCPTTRPSCDLGPRGYYTYAPQYDCYEEGWPSCCSNTPSANCPIQQPSCDKQPDPTTQAPAPLGSDYCTHAPDKDCYLTGWPVCCSSPHSQLCPPSKPSCEISPKPVYGDDYCTDAPDTTCYMTGWPSCCSEKTRNCPAAKPSCELLY